MPHVCRAVGSPCSVNHRSFRGARNPAVFGIGLSPGDGEFGHPRPTVRCLSGRKLHSVHRLLQFRAATAAATPLCPRGWAGPALGSGCFTARPSVRWNVRSSGADSAKGARPLVVLTVIHCSDAGHVPLGAWRGADEHRRAAEALTALAAARFVVRLRGRFSYDRLRSGFFLAYLIHRRALSGWRWVDAVTPSLFTRREP
jgi:hypothetical protein